MLLLLQLTQILSNFVPTKIQQYIIIMAEINLTQRQKWLLATGLGAGAVIYFASSKLGSAYASTASSLPKLSPDYPSFKNVSYKTVNGRHLLLDIYRPTVAYNNAKLAPVLIFIHGGSWVEASKNNIKKTFRQYVLKTLNQNGIAVVSVDYRLADKSFSHIQHQIADCKDAVRWVRLHGAEYGLDAENIGVWGASAGGQLAMMTAYTSDDYYMGDSALSGTTAKVNYVIDTYGPTNLNSLFRTELNPFMTAFAKLCVRKVILKRNRQLHCVTGYDIETQKKRVMELCREFSPINYVTKDCCPTLIMHGAADTTVKIDQSIQMFVELRKCGVSAKMVRYKRLKHSFCNASVAEAYDVANRILAFVQSQYKG